jgi:hypothetical protein
MTSDLASLTARVERLEKQISRLQSELVTQKLIVADQDGKTRASMTVLEGDVPTLVLNDADGKACVVLRVGKESPGFHLIAPQTDATLQVTVDEGGPDISLFDASGKQRMGLSVRPVLQELAAPELVMYNANGTSGVVLSVIGGRGNLNLADSANADTAIRLQLDDQGPIIVCVRDGKVRWTTP